MVYIKGVTTKATSRLVEFYKDWLTAKSVVDWSKKFKMSAIRI